MATSRNITFTFANETSYDLWTDGKFYAWSGDSSGKFASDGNPARVSTFSTHKAFAACGDSDSATGTEGMVKYWAVPTGATGNSQAVGSLHVYFEVYYTHSSDDNNAMNISGSGVFGSKGTYTWTTSGFSKQADSVSVTVTFAAATGAS